jgi:hypothetical protein
MTRIIFLIKNFLRKKDFILFILVFELNTKESDEIFGKYIICWYEILKN